MMQLKKLMLCWTGGFFLSRKKQHGYYDLLSRVLTPHPRDVEGLNNSSYIYYRNQLYLKLFSVFDFNNLPETWNIDYIKNVLFPMGFIGVVDTPAGVLPLQCGYAGYNVYNFPTQIIVGNPVLGNIERDIGKNGELLYYNYINDNFQSVEPLVKRYATLLSSCDGTLNTSLMNSRVAHVFMANTDAEMETYKKIYDDVSNGKPAVFLKKPTGAQLMETNNEFLNVKNTYIGNDVLLTKRTLMNEFLTEIGIDNANTDKRERLIDAEVNANNAETRALINLWCDTMNGCFNRINKLFNLNINVSINKNIVGRGDNNEFYQPN